MRTLEEVKKELDRRYVAADRKRRRTRRTAAEATLGMMLCSAFALTAVLTYRGGEQNSIYNGDHADVTGTVNVTDGTQESTETTRVADTTAAPNTEAPAETVTTSAVIDTYIPIAPEAPEPEEDKDSVTETAADSTASTESAEPSDSTVGTEAPPPTSTIVTTENNGEKPITSHRHNTPKYPGGQINAHADRRRETGIGNRAQRQAYGCSGGAASRESARHFYRIQESRTERYW